MGFLFLMFETLIFF